MGYGRKRSRTSQELCRAHFQGIETLNLLAKLSVVFALGVISLPTALAADPKPDAAIKNKMIDASVFLDDKIKADPALTTDCLTEGKAWAEKNRADADKERKQDPQMFRNGAWSMERKYETRSVVDSHYVSIVRSDYMDSGGAHPNSNVNTILWDSAASKRISIRPFFPESDVGGPPMKGMAKAGLA